MLAAKLCDETDLFADAYQVIQVHSALTRNILTIHISSLVATRPHEPCKIHQRNKISQRVSLSSRKSSPEGLIITKRGRPMARLIPYEMQPEEMIGCLEGEFEIRGDIYSTGITWEATKESNE